MNLKYKILTFSLLMSGLGFTSCDDFLTQENEHQLTELALRPHHAAGILRRQQWD